MKSTVSSTGRRGALPIAALFALVLLSPATALAASGTAGTFEEPECTLRANQVPAPAKKPLRPPITLTAEPATEIVNFGTDRGEKSFYVVVKASRRLPGTVKPKQIELSVPRPPQRVSDTLESASLAFPTFSRPRFISGRKEVQFRVCVNAAGAKPGAYASQIFIGGPKGLNGTSVTATITAKEKFWFWFGFIVVLLAALILLIAIVQQDMKHNTWWLRIITIAGSLIAALGAMFTIYNSDPAWGADPIASIFALGGTAFGAAGVGSLVTTILRRGEGSPGGGGGGGN